MGSIEISKTFSRLKSVSSIGNDYLETAAGGVLYKKLFLKIFKYLQESNCVGVLFNKVAGLQICWKETPTLVFSFACWEIFKNTYFEKHQRTAASDYSFTSAIYLSLYNYKEKQ